MKVFEYTILKMKIPKLHLKYAYPLDNERRQLFADKNFGDYPSFEVIENKLEEWKKVWEELNTDDRIIKRLTELTGLTLSRDLELYIFGRGIRPMSNPLMMPIMNFKGKIFTDDEFTEIVIHEIAHRFVGDLENNPGLENYWNMIRKEYANESILTQNHIIIYALLDIILMEIFGKERLKNFIHPKNYDYEKAVAIVSEKRAENLINEFRGYLL